MRLRLRECSKQTKLEGERARAEEWGNELQRTYNDVVCIVVLLIVILLVVAAVNIVVTIVVGANSTITVQRCVRVVLIGDVVIEIIIINRLVAVRVWIIVMCVITVVFVVAVVVAGKFECRWWTNCQQRGQWQSGMALRLCRWRRGRDGERDTSVCARALSGGLQSYVSYRHTHTHTHTE